MRLTKLLTIHVLAVMCGLIVGTVRNAEAAEPMCEALDRGVVARPIPDAPPVTSAVTSSIFIEKQLLIQNRLKAF